MKDKITAQDVLKIMLENEELKEEIERQSKAQVILDNENAELNYIINKAREYINEDKNCVPKHIKEYFKGLLDKVGEEQ